jgi:ABC-type arginine/histidine transport system permease subunit
MANVECIIMPLMLNVNFPMYVNFIIWVLKGQHLVFVLFNIATCFAKYTWMWMFSYCLHLMLEKYVKVLMIVYIYIFK